jgi:predicted RNase H-like nuclease (RuvC/YqgF family)
MKTNEIKEFREKWSNPKRFEMEAKITKLEKENKELKKQIEKVQAENNDLENAIECFANAYGYDVNEILEP